MRRSDAHHIAVGLVLVGIFIWLCANSAAGAPWKRDLAHDAIPIGAEGLVDQPFTNGSFEDNDGVNSNVFAGWTVIDVGSGSWFVQTGIMGAGVPPLIAGSEATVAAPPDGTFAAMTNQDEGGLHVLYQDFTVPGGGAMLRCDVFVQSLTADFVIPDPETLDASIADANQHARIDLMDPVADPVGIDVLRNLFITRPGDLGSTSNPMPAYVPVTADLTAFTGRMVRLRIAEVDNQNYFNLGIDNCTLSAIGPPAMTCAGDCGQNDIVTRRDILTMLSVALGHADIDACLLGDPSADGIITVDEILAAGRHLEDGCPGFVFGTNFDEFATGTPVEELVVDGIAFLALPPGSWQTGLSVFTGLIGQALYQTQGPGSLDIAFVIPQREVHLRFALDDATLEASLRVEALNGTQVIGSVTQGATQTGNLRGGEVTFVSATAFDRIHISATRDSALIAIDDLRADVRPRP